MLADYSLVCSENQEQTVEYKVMTTIQGGQQSRINTIEVVTKAVMTAKEKLESL